MHVANLWNQHSYLRKRMTFGLEELLVIALVILALLVAI